MPSALSWTLNQHILALFCHIHTDADIYMYISTWMCSLTLSLALWLKLLFFTSWAGCNQADLVSPDPPAPSQAPQQLFIHINNDSTCQMLIIKQMSTLITATRSADPSKWPDSTRPPYTFIHLPIKQSQKKRSYHSITKIRGQSTKWRCFNLIGTIIIIIIIMILFQVIETCSSLSTFRRWTKRTLMWS